MAETKAKNSKSTQDFWARYERMASRPSRKRKGMNLSRISRLTKTGEEVVVADKVLGAGKLAHPLTVSALGFSGSAREMIKRAGGKIADVEELKKKSPKGENVKMLI